MNSSFEDKTGAAEIVSYRDALPTHFTFKIQSFSQLITATSSMEKYESNAFEAGGYKWKLVLCPNGNKTTASSTSSTQNGLSTGNHVSMHLKIVDTNSLPRGWIVDVSFRFFVLDQNRDRYLILGDMGGRTRRFHEMKTMWGYSQLLPLTTTLNDSSNGYLVDNSCVFGVEVFPCKNTGCGDCLTMVESPSCFKYTWKIENFSKIKEESIYSTVFVSGGHKWNIKLLPKGDSRTNRENVSMFLCLNASTDALESAGGVQILAKFKLSMRDQLHDFHKEDDEEKKWFIAPSGWGCLMLIRLNELYDKSKGYLVNDTCIVEAEVTVLGVLKKLS